MDTRITSDMRAVPSPRRRTAAERERAERADSRRHKAGKACVNCRRQKMKCVDSQDPRGCRRCVRSGVPCIFVPRANAAMLPEGLLAMAEGVSADRVFRESVLRRLHALEALLGMSEDGRGETDDVAAGQEADAIDGIATIDAIDADDADLDETPPEYASLGALWEATAVLRASAPPSVPTSIWRKAAVGSLWTAFHERMPGLHFMPRRQTFSAPQPLLVVSILYCSSSRGPPATAAALAPHYFAVLCNAIGQLSVPDSRLGAPVIQAAGGPGDIHEEWAFQTVLGILLAGLLTEASVAVTGLWISVAYRLILEHCPADPALLGGGGGGGDGDGSGGAGGGGGREWRKLFSGVQIVDLEHASLHLSCPVIPLESPLPALRVGSRDQLYRLSRMMHTGLTHFTGRGLPTIWSVFVGGDEGRSSSQAAMTTSREQTFSPIDAAVLRDWAHQLDAWRVEFTSQPVPAGGLDGGAAATRDRQLVLRQYVLHRLVVLSIYHPARGCDLWSSGLSPQEQRELLLSARATLKLHLHDDTIWSNWDLVMITWAALIVVQGVEGGAGEVDDLRNIRVHLEMLKQMNEQSSLCGRLIARLEESLRGVHTPEAALTLPTPFLDGSPGMDYGAWQIFDQASLQQISWGWP